MKTSSPLPRSGRPGFTLLELLVVMVILGLLGGYVGPKYFAQVGKSETKAARAQIEALEKSFDMFRLDTNPWGRAYICKFPGDHGDDDIFSLGKDVRPGGEGDNADVTNR